MSVFKDWANQCIDRVSSLDTLYDNAKTHFEREASAPNDDGGAHNNNNDNRVANMTYYSDLALLISTMGNPLSSKSNDQKIKALNVLLGSIDGIKINAQNGVGAARFEELPMKMFQSMGRFFVEHCRPVLSGQALVVQPDLLDSVPTDNNSDKYDGEDVRDVALNCVCSLMESHIIISFNDERKDEVICSRITIMQDAIRARCASVEDDDEDDAGMIYDEDEDDCGEVDQQGNAAQMKILSGLSLLSRSKRSLCFTVLESTLKGISNDIAYHTQKKFVFKVKTVEKLIFFTNFANACLHGESDPRCLIQMLNILKEIQLVLLPSCFNKEVTMNICDNSKDLKFPFLTMFDSVAPYYPIKFTPPKNDPWGITRERLRNSLMNVFTSYIDSEKAFIDNSTYGSENMIALAVQLVLERLSPPSEYSEEDEDIDITTQDRIEALEDLSTLLVMTDVDNLGGTRNERQNKVFECLSVDIVKGLSNILLRCHEDAAIAVASSSNKDDENENKILANACRGLVNSLAYELEIRSQIQVQVNDSDSQETTRKMVKSLWSCFVSDQITGLCNLMSSSPQSMKGRVAIAYVASLSACGGEKTLRLCLNRCIPIFLQLLENVESSNNDEEQISTAVYGVGVFFSSARVSMEKISQQNVVIHPHPLEEYASQSIETLTKIIVKDSMSLQAKSAAIKALESVLISSPYFLFEGTITSTVRHTIHYIGQQLIDSFKGNNDEDDEESIKFNFANAQFIGTSIGVAMKGEGSSHCQEDTFLKRDAKIMEYFQTTLLPIILESSSGTFKSKDVARMDWKILAFACQMGEMNVSRIILDHLFESLHKLIELKDISQTKMTSKAISYLFQKGGVNPLQCAKIKGYHFDLIRFLADQATSQSDNDFEMSTLLLPEVRKEQQIEADNTMELASVALPFLSVAFQDGKTDDVNSIITRISQLLPPLSELDQTRLSVFLPVLAILLENDFGDKESACDILPNLAEYQLTKDNRTIARIAASSCTFTIATKHLQEQNDIIGNKVLNRLIMPFFLSKIYLIQNSASFEGLVELLDAINAISCIGSSAMYHTGDLSGILDEAAKFLTTIACSGIAHSSTFGMQVPCDLKAICNNFNTVSITAANSLGSILSVSNVSGRNPFWKQRILHKIYPLVHSNINSIRVEYGRILCACHMVCCIPISAFGEKRLSELATVIIDGINNVTTFEDKEQTRIMQDLQTVSLTSMLKIINSAPKMVNGHFRKIIPMCLLVLLSSKWNNLEATSILTSLQILTSISHTRHSNRNSACELYRDVVLSTLAKLLDHPSFQIRRAAAHTRNTWFIL